MNISRFVVAAIFASCTLGNLQGVGASNPNKKSRDRKVYVDRHLIKAVPQGIIVTQGRRAFLVKALRSDQKGMFFLKKDRLTFVEKGRGRWKCDRCPRVFDTQQELLWHILEEHT